MIGRNDPCPCGSGKKYKKCHLRTEELEALGPYSKAARPAGVSRWHDREESLMLTMLEFRGRRFPGVPVILPAEPSGLMHQILAPWTFYVSHLNGRPLVDWFLEEKGRSLPRDERGFLEAQRRACVSVWEARSVDVEVGAVAVTDLLTAAERRVHDVSLSRIARPGFCFLARAVDVGEECIFSGSHPVGVPLEQARKVVQVFLSEAQLEIPVQSDDLRGPNAELLFELWHDSFA